MIKRPGLFLESLLDFWLARLVFWAALIIITSSLAGASSVLTMLLLLTSPLLLVALTSALPSFFTLTPYAPVSAECPSYPLTRKAESLSADEAWYREHRATVAAQSLREWYTVLNQDLPGNDSFPVDKMPVVGIASSGGSVRALLAGAGVIQALDNKDDVPASFGSGLKGLYQGMTYHTGLEAGAWLLIARLANPDATVSSLVNNIWSSSFSTHDFRPANARGPATYATIALDLVAKALAGYPPTLADTWGRLLSQHFLYGADGGVTKTLSGMVNSSDWQGYNMPYPILTALAIDPSAGSSRCISADSSSPQYEFHPVEFGSWDPNIRSFARTAYMGSPSSNGMALSRGTCVHGFDNLGFLLAASGNEFNYWCSEIPRPNLLTGPLGELKDDLIGMTAMVHELSFLDEYPVIPHSNLSGTSFSPMQNNDLYLVSGDEGGENIPIWPLLQEERGIDVILANDNSQDTADFFPNGTSLYSTYLRAEKMGLSTMPLIPPPEVFLERGYNSRPTFFGCYNPQKVAIVYLPNVAHTFQSNIPSWIMKYSSEEVMLMLENGNQVATYGGHEVYKKCLACIMLWKVNEGHGLPEECEQCRQTFCYRP